MEDPAAAPEVVPAPAADATPDTDKSALLAAMASSSSQALQPALREDQVGNAVNFLTNPKVVSSNASSKRQFLLSKGLTDAEIDEAVKRATPLIAAAPPASAATPGAAHSGAAAPPAPVAAPAKEPSGATQVVAQPQRTWMHSAVQVTVLGAAAYGVGTLVSPFVLRWWKAVFPDKHDDSEDEQQATVSKLLHMFTSYVQKQDDTMNELHEVADAVKALQDRDNTTDPKKSQSINNELSELRQEMQRLSTVIENTSALSKEVSELKSLVHQPHTTMSSPEITSRFRPLPIGAASVSAKSFPEPDTSGAADRAASKPFESPSGSPDRGIDRPSSALSNSARGSPQLHQSDDLPAFSRPVNDDNDPHLHRRAGDPAAANNHGVLSIQPVLADANGSSDPYGSQDDSEPAKPAPFLEVLDMLSKGQTPPNVRTDIVDVPPFPDMQPSPATRQRKPKPWEHASKQPSSNGLRSVMQAAAPGAPSNGSMHVQDGGGSSSGSPFQPGYVSSDSAQMAGRLAPPPSFESNFQSSMQAVSAAAASGSPAEAAQAVLDFAQGKGSKNELPKQENGKQSTYAEAVTGTAQPDTVATADGISSYCPEPGSPTEEAL